MLACYFKINTKNNIYSYSKNHTTFFIINLFILIFGCSKICAQKNFWQPDSLPNRCRINTVAGVSGGGTLLLYSGLATIWYKQTGGFHWFDDFPQWQQMDKAGHTFGAYHISVTMMQGLKWAGLPRKKVLLWGGLTGFLVMSPIEIFDGFSPNYGASASDLAFNALGAGLAFGNEWIWHEQRLVLKYSFSPSGYANQAPNLLGKNLIQQMIKDYNGITIWLSTSVGNWYKQAPKGLAPLGLSIGYGGAGMIGEYGKISNDIINKREYRQFYLGLDIDLRQIPTQKLWLRTLLHTLNIIHLPLPALEINRQALRWHWLYF